jgi:hypothetical protein
MKYVRVFHMLVSHGHSPIHAGDIIVEAMRKDRFALNWIRRVHAMVPRKIWITRKQKAR